MRSVNGNLGRSLNIRTIIYKEVKRIKGVVDVVNYWATMCLSSNHLYPLILQVYSLLEGWSSTHQSKISNMCSATSGHCKGPGTIFLSSSNHYFWIILEETTPIRIEMLYHRIKVWSLRTTFYWFAVTLSCKGITGPKPWQQNAAYSRAELSDHLPEWVKHSGLYHSLHICTSRVIENMLKDDSSHHFLFPDL